MNNKDKSSLKKVKDAIRKAKLSAKKEEKEKIRQEKEKIKKHKKEIKKQKQALIKRSDNTLVNVANDAISKAKETIRSAKMAIKNAKENADIKISKAKEDAVNALKNPVNSLVRLATDHPFIIIALVIIITIAVVPGVFTIKTDNNIRGYFAKDFPTLLKGDYIEKVFGISKSIFFVAVEADDIYTEDVLEYVNLLHQQFDAELSDIDTVIKDGKEYTKADDNFSDILKSNPEAIIIDGVKHEYTTAIVKNYIREVNSIINAVDVTTDGDSLETFDFIEEQNGVRVIPATDEEIKKLRTRLLDNENYEGLFYSEITNDKGNPNAWVIAVEMYNEHISNYYAVIDYIEEMLEQTKEKGYDTRLFGVDYINKYMNVESVNDVKTQIAVVIFVIMIVFFLNFRSPMGVIIPEITTIISVLWIFGLMGYFNIKFSLVSLLLVPVLLAVSSSYSIHALNQYYKECNTYSEKNKHKDIASSMNHILKTIVVAGLTTATSLISLLISSTIVHLKAFGLFASIGVFFSVVLSLTFIPALLVLLPIKRNKKTQDFSNTLMDKMVRKTTYFIIKHRVGVFITLLVIGIGFVIGIYFITSDSSFVTMFKKDHKIRPLSDYFSKNFGGVSSLNISIDTVPKSKDSISKGMDEYRKNLFSKEVENDTSKNELNIEQEKVIDNTTEEITNNDPFADDDTGSVDDPFADDDTGSVDDPFADDDTGSVDDPFADDDTGSVDDPFADDDTGSVDDPFADDNTGSVDDPFADEGSNSETDYSNIISEDDGGGNYFDIDNEELTLVNQALNSELLLKVDKMKAYAEGISGVGRFYSYADIMKRFNYIWNNKNPDYKRIPETNNIVLEYKEMFNGDDENNDGVVDHIDNLIDPTYNKINIIVMLKDIDGRAINTGDYNRIEKDLSDYMDKHFSDMNIDYYITGWAILHKDIQDEIVKGQLISVLFSFVVIGIIISILFRSITTGVISIIPLSASIFVTFGLMGYTQVPLDMATALISALAIGIAVDDTLHYMLNLRKAKADLGDDADIESIIYKTSNHTSKAIIYTSVALIFGFLVLIFSTFIPIRLFAYLTAFTLLIATIATLWALPSVLLIFPQLIGVRNKSGKSFTVDPNINPEDPSNKNE